MKKLLKILGILSLTLLVLLIASFFVLKALFPPAKLREMVEPRIEKAIEREIEFGEIGIVFSWGFGIRLEDLKISNRKGFSDKDFLTVDRILLKINLRPLLKRQIQVSHIILEKPEVLIERNKTGEFNFGDWQRRRESIGKAMEEEERKKRERAQFALFLTSLRVKNGTLIFEDYFINRTIKISNYNQDLSLAFQEDNLQSEGGVTIGDLQVITPLFPLTGLAFEVDESISLDLSQNRLLIEKLDIKTGDLSFPFTGSVEEMGVEPKIHLSMEKKGIELPKLLSLVPSPFSENMKKYQSHGKLDIELKVDSKGKGEPNIQGKTSLHQIGLSGGALRQPLSGIEGSLNFSQREFTFTNIQGKIGGSSFTLSGNGVRASKPRITFDLKLDKVVGEDWMTPPGAVPAEPQMESLPPFLPDFSGTAFIDEIYFRKLKVENFKGNIDLENGFFNLKDGVCDLYGGKGAGNLGMDLRDLKKRKFQTDIQMKGVEVNNLFSSLTPFKEIFFGKVEGNLFLSGEGSTPEEIKKTLTGKGFGKLESGKIENLTLQNKLAEWTKKDFFKRIQFQDLSQSFTLDKGDLIFDNFTLAGRDADWLLSGMIGLDRSLNWDVTCRLSSALSQGFGLEGLTQFFKDEEGRIILDFLVGGTLENPKFAWNTARTKDRIEKRISGEIEKKKSEAEESARKELEKKKESAKKEFEKKKEEVKKELEEKAKEGLKKIFPR